jgi:hypothetical protein
MKTDRLGESERKAGCFQPRNRIKRRREQKELALALQNRAMSPAPQTGRPA